jgi:pimeloyl-ACP methyl ester carboxylesterase
MKKCQTRDINVAYQEQGQGQPILLVHGFPLDHSMWVEQIAALAKEYRVLAPDLRGFGQTPLAAGESEADQLAARGIEMHQYAADLAAFLDALQIEEPVTFVGFSMGGYVAWQFWKRRPQRLRALVLCDTRAVADAEDAKKGRLEMAEHVCDWGSSRVADMMLPKLLAAQSLAQKPQVVEAARQVIQSTDPRAIAAAQRGMAARPDVTEWLPRMDLPALVLVGAEDAISRVEEMQQVAEAMPRAEFKVIANAGHMAPVENPEEVNTAMARFMKTLSSGP